MGGLQKSHKTRCVQGEMIKETKRTRDKKKKKKIGVGERASLGSREEEKEGGEFHLPAPAPAVSGHPTIVRKRGKKNFFFHLPQGRNS